MYVHSLKTCQYVIACNVALFSLPHFFFVCMFLFFFAKLLELTPFSPLTIRRIPMLSLSSIDDLLLATNEPRLESLFVG